MWRGIWKKLGAEGERLSEDKGHRAFRPRTLS